MNSNEPTILLAEDDDNDVFFMRRGLQKAGIQFQLRVVTHGQEAIDYLAGTGRFADRTQFPVPSLLLLDLKMPFANGFEVLAWIQTELKELPVVVLTSSAEERDRQKAAELGAKGYFVKPPTREMVLEMMQFMRTAAPISA